MTKATAPRHSAPTVPASPFIEDCPVLDPETAAKLDACREAGKTFTRACDTFLAGRAPKGRAAWLKTTVAASRTVFQPWSMEILYTIATLRQSRFNELHDLLGMSSRTLSDKLKALKEAGLVERDVLDEQPVRVEYSLTQHGRDTVALASPLFAHLNLEALRVAEAATPGSE